MINTSPKVNQSIGDINFLVIEYLRSIPFIDNEQKEQLINKVRLYLFYNIYFCFANVMI